MERSRSKRAYYYDQDYDSEAMGGRRRPRYNHHYNSNNHRYRVGTSGGGGGGGRPSKTQDSSAMVTTSYRILCHDLKAGGVIGKSGSIIKSIRQHTGAWINVHELISGDEERIIEITDTRRRDPEGRMPSFSPAQEALLLIHERILESDSGFVGDDDDEYDGRGGSGSSHHRVATRLVVSRMHVGCLLGKGGKIIEQMRMETKTQIRILPRDHNLPRCVSMSEEIVQVVGDVTAVKNALAIISSRLRESQHRDRSHFLGRLHSPDHFFPEEDYNPHVNNAGRRSSIDGPAFGSRLSAAKMRNSNYNSRSSSFSFEAGEAPMMDDGQPCFGEDIVFRILCPIEKVDQIVGDSDGIVELLQNEIGVAVKVTEPVVGSEEQIIIISSEEGPDDELFPAQEALLHIQTRIVDLVPDKDNIVTTRLLIPSNDVECLDGKDISLLELSRLTGATIQIVPREELPVCVTKTDELVQIVGEIKAAREAIVEVTSRLRNFLYRDFFQKGNTLPSDHIPELEVSSPNNVLPVREAQVVSDSNTDHQNARSVDAAPPSNEETGGSSTETAKQREIDRRDEVMTGVSRIAVPLVTRSILEVVLPNYAAPKLTRNKLVHMSEFSGAKVTLVEDSPEATEKVIQISGTPEQAEKAQSLLQGFILSTQDDGP